ISPVAIGIGLLALTSAIASMFSGRSASSKKNGRYGFSASAISSARTGSKVLGGEAAPNPASSPPAFGTASHRFGESRTDWLTRIWVQLGGCGRILGAV